MDDDKSIIEKVTDAVKGAAHTIMDVASNAAGDAMQANSKKMSPDVEHIAATNNEQIYIPVATDAAAVPPPLFPARDKRTARARTKKRAAKAKSPQARTAKKAASKKARKSSKKSSMKPAAKKTAKKGPKKRPRKSPTKAAKKKKTRRG
jgi:hypothetical protein